MRYSSYYFRAQRIHYFRAQRIHASSLSSLSAPSSLLPPGPGTPPKLVPLSESLGAYACPPFRFLAVAANGSGGECRPCRRRRRRRQAAAHTHRRGARGERQGEAPRQCPGRARCAHKLDAEDFRVEVHVRVALVDRRLSTGSCRGTSSACARSALPQGGMPPNLHAQGATTPAAWLRPCPQMSGTGRALAIPSMLPLPAGTVHASMQVLGVDSERRQGLSVRVCASCEPGHQHAHATELQG